MKFIGRTAFAAVAALNALRASAAISTVCPSDSKDVCYGWGVPETAAKSGSGNLYFQLSAPTSYEWIALGIGSGMAGADIFLIYQDGKGNVTLSTRKGKGHVEPEYTKMDGVELIDGSGVKDGKMIANVMCSNCDNVDLGGSSSWISAWKKGSPLNSASTSAEITMHDDKTVYEVDLSKASISSDANPFTSTSASGGSHTSPSSGGSSSGGVTETGGDDDGDMTLLNAHGVIMTLVFAFGYPFGSILISLVRKWFIHAGFQTVVFLLMWAGFGIGYTIAKKDDLFFNSTHTQLGTIVVALMALQPVLGWVHHTKFQSTGSRGVFSHIHVWYGRALMVLGIVNGGLGLKLANAATSWATAYSVVAGVFGGLYISSAILGAIKGKKRHEKHLSPAMTHETS